jgi:hypothetical protein
VEVDPAGRDPAGRDGDVVTAWLRRNRWGLLALPVVAALAVGANAQRLHDYWWNADLRNESASGARGDWVTWSGRFSDATGDSTRAFQIRVTGAEPTDVAGAPDDQTKLDLPPGLTGVRVSADFQANPDQVLFGCRMALLDDAGNRYTYTARIQRASQDIWPCVPEDHPGPMPSITAGEQRAALPGEERPETWSTAPVFLVPRDARITQVLLWWEQPDYLAVRLD